VPATQPRSRLARPGIALISGIIVLSVALAGTAVALGHLTRLPLGKGAAVVSWTGGSLTPPTVVSVHGRAGGLTILATDKIPNPLSGNAASQPIPSGPASYPLGTVKGTIDGAAFTLKIAFTIPDEATAGTLDTYGTVTGTFRNQPVRMTLTADPDSVVIVFAGRIGADHISGTLQSIVHRGKVATAKAVFDVTK
jgi:hypothetical protein